MKHKPNKFALLSSTLSVIALLLPLTALAKDIHMYDQPKADAKVIGSVDLATGVVPIFTSKEGDWMKVGDPRNGNVGWIKSNEMSTPGTPTSFTFTQKITNDKSGPHSYQLLQYGKPTNMDSAQAQEMLKKMQMQSQVIQQRTQKAIQDMMTEMNNLYQWNSMNGMGNFPVIMPIVIVPAEKAPASKPASTHK